MDNNILIIMLLNFISSYCLGVLGSTNKKISGLNGLFMIILIVIFSITSIYILAEINHLNLNFKG